MFDTIKNIHFVGIGGSGMSGIAEILITLGYNVAGSDVNRSTVTDRLKKLGAKIFLKHDSKNIKNIDVVVVSTAIKSNNPEVLCAHKKKIPVIPRAEMLSELMRIKYSIAVGGTHGKTTTTSMISWIMHQAGIDPTVVIGGRVNNFGTGAKLGQGRFIVAEADESDGSFLKLNPTITVVTNIDNDHMDYHKNMANLTNSFIEFINKTPFYGWSVLCNDDPCVRKIMPKLHRRFFTYGIKHDSDLMAKNIKAINQHMCFKVFWKKKLLGDIKLTVPGLHNVSNALASILTCLELGVEFNTIKDALLEFKGVGRRLEIKGEKKDITVIDDYGHHPSEIVAVWNSINDFWNKNKVYVVFQPHRYSRTKSLAKDFAKALKSMKQLILLPIYSAGEKSIKGITSKTILNEIPLNKKKNVFCANSQDQAILFLLKKLKQGNVVLTLGAGDVFKVGEKLLEKL